MLAKENFGFKKRKCVLKKRAITDQLKIEQSALSGKALKENNGR